MSETGRLCSTPKEKLISFWETWKQQDKKMHQNFSKLSLRLRLNQILWQCAIVEFPSVCKLDVKWDNCLKAVAKHFVAKIACSFLSSYFHCQLPQPNSLLVWFSAHQHSSCNWKLLLVSFLAFAQLKPPSIPLRIFSLLFSLSLLWSQYFHYPLWCWIE